MLRSVFFVLLTLPLFLFQTTAFTSYRHQSSTSKARLFGVEGTEPVQTKLLFVETGFGCDQHGQNSTKAAVRACRNAIEFNSLPSLREIIPGGKENMILKVQIAVPDPTTVDVSQILKVFPYGKIVTSVIDGGMRANSGIVLKEMGDRNDDMIIAVAAVYVGY